MQTIEQIMERLNQSPNLWASLLQSSQEPFQKSFDSNDSHASICKISKKEPWNWAIDEQSTAYKSLVGFCGESPLYNQQLDLSDRNTDQTSFLGQFSGRSNENPRSGQLSEKHNPDGKYKPEKLEDSRSSCFPNLEHDCESIFRDKKIRKNIKKNTNIPKFLVRIYLKHFSAYNGKKKSKFLEFHKRVKNQLKGRISNNYKISDLLRLFRETHRHDQQIERNNREVMARILREEGTKEILQSNYIRGNTVSYLMGNKIYSLRCRYSGLTDRVKIF